MAFVTDGTLGVDLTNTKAGTGTSFDQGGQFAVGQRVTATDGSNWLYVHAAEAVAQYDCVAIDENFEVRKITKALADAGHGVGFAQVALADNDFGWVAVNSPGNITVNVLASCAADVQLYTSGTAGKLDDTSASQNLIRGVVLVTAATNTASSREAIAVYPSATATP
jgi:hypothetical protein